MANEKVKGTLHILRNFHEIDKTGVYDLAYTKDDSSDPDPHQPIHRLFGETELTNFLRSKLHRDHTQVQKILSEVQENGRARIHGLDFDREQLRDLDLAA
jgi:hypothetical protein